jgi:ABC-type sugar transport system ATPase subunit
MAAITIERVSKRFDQQHAAVREIDLQIGDGELVVLLGPSGSGKSTLLRLIAGLEQATSGRILIDGVDVTSLPPQKRDLAMVFQSYALYPHKNVRENLAFSLRMKGRSRGEIESRVREVSKSLQIEGLLDRRPAQLSGGQRQRVALGRAMVREPKAFLFDEPLSNLDPGLRLETRTELALLHRRLGVTMIYVTHDQEEAMKLGERLVLLRDGRVEQIGPPMEIYTKPASLFAARFLGSPPMNILRRVGGLSADEVLGVRPQDVRLTSVDGGELKGTIELVEAAGSEQHVHVRLDGDPAERIVVVTPAEPRPPVGERVGVVLQPDRVHRLPSE